MTYLIVTTWILLAVGLLLTAIYGLYLSFSASIVLGIIVMIVEPAPLIIGLFMILFNFNLAQAIMDFMSK